MVGGGKSAGIYDWFVDPAYDRKDLVRKYARQFPVPTYVVEFMLGRYCASIDPDEIAEGLEIVERQLDDPRYGLTHNLGGMPHMNICSITIVGRNSK